MSVCSCWQDILPCDKTIVLRALQTEGSVWRAVSLLAAAGQLHGALDLLRGAGLPDAALGFSRACQEAGFGGQPPAGASLDSGEALAADLGMAASSPVPTQQLADLYPHGMAGGVGAASYQPRSVAQSSTGPAGVQPSEEVEVEYLQYVVQLLQAL